MVNEDNDKRELSKIGERISGAIEKLAEAQKEEAIAEKQEAKAETKIAEVEKQKEKKSLMDTIKKKGGFITSNALGTVGIGASSFAKSISQSSLIFAMIVSLANYWFKFQLGGGVLILHLVTFLFLSMFNYGISKGFLLLALFLEISSLFFPVSLGGWITLIPWFAAFVFISFILDITREGFTSRASKWALILTIVLVILFGMPKFGYTSASITASQKEAISNVIDNLANYLSTTKAYWLSKFHELQCSTDPTSIECKKAEQKEAPIAIETSLPTQFIFKLNKMPDTRPFSQQIDEVYSYANLLQKTINVDFSCEISDLEKGMANPSSITLGINERKNNQKITCIFNKKMERGTKTFNITALLKGIQSKSIKTQYFIDEKTKNAEEGKYLSENNIPMFASVSEQNSFLKNSYGKYLTESVTTRTADDFLISAIKLGSETVNPNEKTLLVYGAEQFTTRIPFAVYLQKNKKGNVVKINNIRINLPPGMQLDPINCGYDSSYLNSVDWKEELKLTGEENQFGLKSCDLIFTDKLPNIPTLKQIEVIVDYDFELTEKTELYAKAGG